MKSYNRISPRAQRYDYTSPGMYFVTMVTKDRQCFFGDITGDPNPVMQLSDIGRVCEQEVQQTPIRRPHVVLDSYVVMPNHIHLLLSVGTHGNASINNDTHTNDGDVGNTIVCNDDNAKDTLPRVPTESLWSIIGNFKSRVSRYANQHNIYFAWQSRYHDHIVRNIQDYERIIYYIQQNPYNRHKDRFYQ